MSEPLEHLRTALAGRYRVERELGVGGMATVYLAHDLRRNRLVYAVYREEANLWSLPIPRRGRAPVNIDRAVQLTSGTEVVETMHVSRDERWVTYDSNIAGSADIYRIPAAGGEPERLTSDPGHEFYPVLSPDNTEFAYHSPRGGSRDLYVRRIGADTAHQLTATPMQECCAMWSRDGRTLGYTDYLGDQGIFLIHRDASDSGTPRVLYTAADTLRDPIVGRVDFARDDAGVYFNSHDAMGRGSIRYLPLSGGRPTMVMRFDDLARQSYRSNFAVGAGRFFFAINDRQSDVWVAELTTR